LHKISLAEWSFNKALFAGEMDHLDFAKVAKREFGLDGVDYVNQFFKDKGSDADYLAEMNTRAIDEGVESLLIMVDGEGNLGDADPNKRTRAIQNHYKWVSAAKLLGCHSIRVNAATGDQGSFEEQMKRAADGLGRLSEYAADVKLNVIVENHGGLSSNGKWLSGVMAMVNLPNCATLPDFGNFRIQGDEWYDRYQGVEELMPYAKAVSAKSHKFDAEGNETETDYLRMMKIVLAAGYRGYVGIEFEGGGGAVSGVQKTVDLLRRVRAELAQSGEFS
jgi:sugar phosphate isomerase/epimerase